MTIVLLLVALLLIGSVLWDSFETIILPRTVTRRFRITRLYFRGTWRPWAWVAGRMKSEGQRERFLAVYGPLSLLSLLATWAIVFVVGFALLHYVSGSHLQQTDTGERPDFLVDLYMSGTTFTTLGLGDVHPVGTLPRVLTVIEGGMGFGFLAIVVSYFPVLYSAFSRRESRLTLLDAWAGSPPAAGEILRRLAVAKETDELEPFLKDWEAWCSDILESHISYPIVAYFRSQHQHQSWVSALTTILDVCAFVQAGIEDIPPWQAYLTFAIARHAAVDLAQVLRGKLEMDHDRLPAGSLEKFRQQLERAGLRPVRSAQADARLLELRRSYEPYVAGLAVSLMMPLPRWWREHTARDNWQTSPRKDGGPHL